MKRFQSQPNRNLPAIMVSYLVVAMGLSATLIFGVIGDTISPVYMVTAIAFFVLVGMIPFLAMRPEAASRYRGPKVTWGERFARMFGRSTKKEKPIKAWKRKRPEFVHEPFGNEYIGGNPDAVFVPNKEDNSTSKRAQ